MKRKALYFGLNLIAPGIGQLAAGCWFRGSVQLLAALVCFFGCVWEALAPIVVSMMNLLNDSSEIKYISVPRVLAYIGILIVLWIFSMIDLSLICRRIKDEPEKDGKPEAGHPS